MAKEKQNKDGLEPTPWTGPRIDPDDPPYARLRTLLKAAFEAKSLRRIEDEAVFAGMRHRFAPGDNVDDLVDELFEFCRTGMLWDELATFVAGRNPKVYNRFAAQWGWPPVPAAAPPPAGPPADPEREGLEHALRMARRTLAILEEQAAGFGALHLPAHLAIELEEQRRKVADLEARLK